MHHNSTLQGNLKLFEKVNEQVPRKGGGTKSALRYRMLRQDEQKAHMAMEGTHVKEEILRVLKDLNLLTDEEFKNETYWYDNGK